MTFSSLQTAILSHCLTASLGCRHIQLTNRSNFALLLRALMMQFTSEAHPYPWIVCMIKVFWVYNTGAFKACTGKI